MRVQLSRVALGGWLVALVALAPRPAAAHLELTSPPSRYGGGVLKEGPCGRTGGARSENVTVFEPGETIEVVFDEYIDHPGHYRVAFDPDGDDDLADPACLSGCDTRTPEIERNTPGVMVLMDGIPDRDVRGDDTLYRVSVTLPDVECERCTLQVIQVMYDKPPQTRPGNDVYYQCADLVLRRSGGSTDAAADTPDAGTAPGADAGPPEAPAGDCACRATPGRGGAGLPWLLGLLLPLARRRRGRRGAGARA
ncbi:MAG TPA: hypothetical protein RMH99_33105 [Sandaracinaceae bacterium LLY-WYZ-13_1]|nr:hypothetical protein [Sandaracinaceae bacterium LLY-WYZ-13_1]